MPELRGCRDRWSTSLDAVVGLALEEIVSRQARDSPLRPAHDARRVAGVIQRRACRKALVTPDEWNGSSSSSEHPG